MGFFRHPHLVRGIVHTSEGAFLIVRGVAELSDEVGASLGWMPIDDEPQSVTRTTRPTSKHGDPAGDHAGAV